MLKKKAYCMLYQFINKRDQILRNLDLPSYQVQWLRVPKTVDHTIIKKTKRPPSDEASEEVMAQESDEDSDSDQHQATR